MKKSYRITIKDVDFTKKYDNTSVYYKDWTTAKLKKEYTSLDRMVYHEECYGVRDMCMLTGIAAELSNRGIKIGSTPRFEED